VFLFASQKLVSKLESDLAKHEHDVSCPTDRKRKFKTRTLKIEGCGTPAEAAMIFAALCGTTLRDSG
jgi:hypothetical protein